MRSIAGDRRAGGARGGRAGGARRLMTMGRRRRVEKPRAPHCSPSSSHVHFPMARTKVFVVYYSMYGHVAKLAQQIKKGVDSVAGCEGHLFQVPETQSEAVLQKMHAPPKPAEIPVITPAKLAEADGIELFEWYYFCQAQREDFFALAKPRDGHPTIAKMQALAKELSVVLPVSFFERSNNAFYNSLVVIDADGTNLGIYRKSHIPDGPGYQEKFYFNPGDTGFKVFKTKYADIGVGICWDQWFPEAARVMVLKGAELLLYPTAIGSEPQDPTLDSREHWTRVMQGHAGANMIPLVASNRVGEEEIQTEHGKSFIKFYGKSFIAGPTGEIVQQANDSDEEVLVATFDLEKLRSQRASWGIFRDRRPDLYRPLLTLDGAMDRTANLAVLSLLAAMAQVNAAAPNTPAACLQQQSPASPAINAPAAFDPHAEPTVQVVENQLTDALRTLAQVGGHIHLLQQRLAKQWGGLPLPNTAASIATPASCAGQRATRALSHLPPVQPSLSDHVVSVTAYMQGGACMSPLVPCTTGAELGDGLPSQSPQRLDGQVVPTVCDIPSSSLQTPQGPSAQQPAEGHDGAGEFVLIPADVQQARLRAFANMLQGVPGQNQPSAHGKSDGGKNDAECAGRCTPLQSASGGREKRKAPMSPSSSCSSAADTDGDAESPPVMELVSSGDAALTSLFTITAGRWYNSIVELRAALRQTAVAMNFEYSVVRSSPQRFIARCRVPDCPWRIRAMAPRGGLRCVVQEVTEHSCSGSTSVKNRHAGKAWVADMFTAKLRHSPTYHAQDIVNDLVRSVGVHVTYKTALRARELALERMSGPPEKGYVNLPSYCRALKDQNPGSVAFVECVEGTDRFNRFFFAFGASLGGFRHCRPLIGLDAVLLSGRYPGVLLGATSIDSMDEPFPLACAVVNSEDRNNWAWFLKALRDALGQGGGPERTFTFISDRENGVVEGVTDIFLDAPHSFCMKHLIKRIKSRFKTKGLGTLMWKAYRAMTTILFDQVMDKLREQEPRVVPWLEESAPPCYWATAHFKGERFGHHTSKIAVSATNAFVGACSQSPTALCDSVCQIVGQWFQERRKQSEQMGGLVVPLVAERLAATRERAQTCVVEPLTTTSFKVCSNSTAEVRPVYQLVDLEHRTCTCGGWQTRGWPCKHAASAIMSQNGILEEWCSPYFTVECLKLTYEGAVHVMPTVQELGPQKGEPNIGPPLTKRQKGRPKVRRIRDVAELYKRGQRCSHCKKAGHNRATCKESPSKVAAQAAATAAAVARALRGSAQGATEGATAKGRHDRRVPRLAVRAQRRSQT
ncbi:hypothetical protein CBR_g2849 [Chara braunii]|uniref:SWIM-type domain-containing protein n=2 Tax=Streptophytina TaxID=131221 RepID=A0A388KEC6_CHABU|nr:hypothetical protein CBR_g2849 [Chara braunii]|eukprot:GBG68303.1 hypothetical protein CBR_g2849 [Chara braunii]